MTYKDLPMQKHDGLTEVLPNIWIVTGASKMPMPLPVSMTIPKNMTIIRNPENGELSIVNSMIVSEAVLKEIESLGTVANVITIGGFHGKDDGFYKERYGATVYAPEGFVYNRKFDDGSVSQADGYMQADVYMTDETSLPIPNASVKIIKAKVNEGILILEQNGGTLITGDSLQNMPGPDKFTSFFAKMMMKKMGFFKSYNVGPGWLQFGEPKKEDIQSFFLNLNYENVVPGHGDPVIGGAKEKYRPVIESGLKGCHE